MRAGVPYRACPSSGCGNQFSPSGSRLLAPLGWCILADHQDLQFLLSSESCAEFRRVSDHRAGMRMSRCPSPGILAAAGHFVPGFTQQIVLGLPEFFKNRFLRWILPSERGRPNPFAIKAGFNSDRMNSETGCDEFGGFTSDFLVG